MKFASAILDSNLIDYAFKDTFKEVALELISRHGSRFTLVISQYSRFEVFRGLSVAKVTSAKAIIDEFENFPVSQEILSLAAALSTCYKSDNHTKSTMDSISDGDLIIAATAFKYNFLIVTANRKDFPDPFFDEVQKDMLESKKGGRVVIHVLKPDFLYLKKVLDSIYTVKSI